MNTAQTVDYWGIVRRSIDIVWKHKFLWFFGFFASAGGGGNLSNWGEQGGGRVRDFFLSHVEILVAVVLGLVFVWLILLVMSLISKGALIGCQDRADRGEPIRFDDAWSTGLRTFWGMLGLFVTAAVAFLVVTVVCALIVVLPLAGGTPGIVIAVLIGAILFLPYVAFMFLLAFTITYAEREYVIAGAGITDALRAGWEMTRRHIWKSMMMWLVALLSGLVFVLGLAIALLVLAVPFIVIGIANAAAGLILGIPVGIAVVLVAAGAYGTYSYSLWTLLYRDLKALDAANPQLAVPMPGGGPGTHGMPAAAPEGRARGAEPAGPARGAEPAGPARDGEDESGRTW